MAVRGVVYCATGDFYLEAGLISAIILRQLEPEIPITIISNHPLVRLLPLDKYEISPRFLEPSELNHDGSFLSREIKTRLSTFSPYKETLFLDADIIPLKPISGIWDYLSPGDMAMALDYHYTLALCEHIESEEKNYTLQYIPATTNHFNSGVILWKDSVETQSLFQVWYQEWLKFKKQDQLALVRAIHHTQISITVLPRSYNISPINAAYLLEHKSAIDIPYLHNVCPLESALLLKPENDVHFLHCWGGLVASGIFRKIAEELYPDIVQQVGEHLAQLSQLNSLV